MLLFIWSSPYSRLILACVEVANDDPRILSRGVQGGGATSSHRLLERKGTDWRQGFAVIAENHCESVCGPEWHRAEKPETVARAGLRLAYFPHGLARVGETERGVPWEKGGKSCDLDVLADRYANEAAARQRCAAPRRSRRKSNR